MSRAGDDRTQMLHDRRPRRARIRVAAVGAAMLAAGTVGFAAAASLASAGEPGVAKHAQGPAAEIMAAITKPADIFGPIAIVTATVYPNGNGDGDAVIRAWQALVGPDAECTVKHVDDDGVQFECERLPEAVASAAIRVRVQHPGWASTVDVRWDSTVFVTVAGQDMQSQAIPVNDAIRSVTGWSADIDDVGAGDDACEFGIRGPGISHAIASRIPQAVADELGLDEEAVSLSPVRISR